MHGDDSSEDYADEASLIYHLFDEMHGYFLGVELVDFKDGIDIFY